MTRILEERAFPVDGFVPLASARSEGFPVTFAGSEHRIRELTAEACRGVDVAFVSAGAHIARRFLPESAANGTVCIENSGAFRMGLDVPPVMPEVNSDARAGWAKAGNIPGPNRTTITAMLAVRP